MKQNTLKILLFIPLDRIYLWELDIQWFDFTMSILPSVLRDPFLDISILMSSRVLIGHRMEDCTHLVQATEQSRWRNIVDQFFFLLDNNCHYLIFVQIWDGISSHCIQTYFKAHDGAEVASVRFSRNGKYILSSGKDSLIKLWEISTNRCLIAYTGAGATGKQVRWSFYFGLDSLLISPPPIW